jgi:hypothetical protein
MDIHNKPIQERIKWLLERAYRHFQTYTSPESYLARRRYLVRHPTAIAALQCMDGRVNISVATKTPPGIIQPFRNLGGYFDLGWPYLNELITHYVYEQIAAGRRILLLITYHYSKGDPHRCCAGFKYDTEAARAHTYAIKRQVEQIFGTGHRTVYPVVCGFETDDDALVLHGVSSEALDISILSPSDVHTVKGQLEVLFPDMPNQVRNDLIPLVLGNANHVAEERQRSRALDLDHREWMICIGQGFGFLNLPNLALIIGPYSPNLAEPIERAVSILENNMKTGRIPSDGFLLLASTPYGEFGVERTRAELKSCFLAHFAAKVIRSGYPQLADKMHVLTAVLDRNSRKLERIAAHHELR